MSYLNTILLDILQIWRTDDVQQVLRQLFQKTVFERNPHIPTGALENERNRHVRIQEQDILKFHPISGPDLANLVYYVL